jgi:hypothetical protein
MMRQVSIPPQRLRNPQQQTEVAREECIYSTGSKEWQVNEIVRDGVGVPPKSDANERYGRREKEESAVRESERHEESVPC